MKRADRRKAKFSAMQTPPPTPQESTMMAARGIDLNRGNSNQQLLSPSGEAEVAHIGERFQNKGGLDKLYGSTAVRGLETAQAIQDADPRDIPQGTTPNLESWAQGNLEGKPMDMVRDQIRQLVRKNPRQTIPGQGALSTRKGESFDEYRGRVLPEVFSIMQELAYDPAQKIGVPVHSQTIKLIRSWIDNGAPDDFSIDPGIMLKEHSEAPGGVVRLHPDDNGEWEMRDVNMESRDKLQPGIYFIRHGITPWNKENYDKTSRGQKALAQISDRAKALDFGRARAIAGDALMDGSITEDDIDKTIDNSLPSPKEAADLPHHHLLAVASAATPKKRSEYSPLLRERFGDLSGLPADASKALNFHLQQLGVA